MDLLEEHFSAKEARRQRDTGLDWGRYAELFAFEDDTHELWLEPPDRAPGAIMSPAGM